MILEVAGHQAHAATGGRYLASANSDPVVILIHGAGMDSTVWSLQTRYLAYRGLRAVAVDLPGHGRSEGEPLTSIEDMASWLDAFMAAAGFESAHLVGHSMGTFIALELAATKPERVQSLSLLGTGPAMPVHPQLLDDAANNLPAASALMAAWGHAKVNHAGPNPTPGLSMVGGAMALVELSTPGALANDFAACAAYQGAEAAAASTTAPAKVIIGLGDKMTPPKAGRALAAKLANVEVIELADTGHSMMVENPRAIRAAVLASVAG